MSICLGRYAVRQRVSASSGAKLTAGDGRNGSPCSSNSEHVGLDMEGAAARSGLQERDWANQRAQHHHLS